MKSRTFYAIAAIGAATWIVFGTAATAAPASAPAHQTHADRQHREAKLLATVSSCSAPAMEESSWSGSPAETSRSTAIDGGIEAKSQRSVDVADNRPPG